MNSEIQEKIRQIRDLEGEIRRLKYGTPTVFLDQIPKSVLELLNCNQDFDSGKITLEFYKEEFGYTHRNGEVEYPNHALKDKEGLLEFLEEIDGMLLRWLDNVRAEVEELRPQIQKCLSDVRNSSIRSGDL